MDQELKNQVQRIADLNQDLNDYDEIISKLDKSGSRPVILVIKDGDQNIENRLLNVFAIKEMLQIKKQEVETEIQKIMRIPATPVKRSPVASPKIDHTKVGVNGIGIPNVSVTPSDVSLIDHIQHSTSPTSEKGNKK